jgi:transcriptional regulator with XRE-family HTH domain
VTVPTKRRQLADELVKVRVRAGMTGRAMAKVLDLSQAQLYRYDHAVTTPTLPTVRTWLDACRAKAPEALDDLGRARILELAEAAHAEPKTWKAHRDAGIVSAQETAADQDADAVELFEAERVILPGLLQTPEYAAAAVRQADLHGQFDHLAQVAGRIARQARLFEPGRTWRFLLAEHLLSESPGLPALMPPQRSRLLALAEIDDVEIAVLPTGARIEPSGLWWAPFTIIQPRDGDRYVVAELPHGEVTVTAPDEVASFELLWERLWKAARTGDEAVKLIRKAGG